MHTVFRIITAHSNNSVVQTVTKCVLFDPPGAKLSFCITEDLKIFSQIRSAVKVSETRASLFDDRDVLLKLDLNCRGENNECLFLRVDIVLQGATFFVVFSNADDMPAPYRIDNFSEVGHIFYQLATITF